LNKLAPAGSRHGRNSDYCAGCKCVECKKAHSDYQRSYYNLHPEQKKKRNERVLQRYHRFGNQWAKENPDKLKAIQRKHKLKQKFGITPEIYERMVFEQGGMCLICSGPPTSSGLAIDHDHETGKIRGLLCSRCNCGLGMFQDDHNILIRAVEYLKIKKATS
jgi:hypothetical protein